MIESLIIMYAPVIVATITTIAALIQSARRIKRINIKDDLKPVSKEVLKLTNEVKDSNKRFEYTKELCNEVLDDNAVTRKEMGILVTDLRREMNAQNEMMIELIKKNVEWEAKARTARKQLNEVQNERKNEEI